MDKYDKLMLAYYKVLNNAWKKEVREASNEAIKALISIKENNLLDSVDDLIEATTQNLSVDLKAELTKPTKAFINDIYKISLQDVSKQVDIGIGISGIKQKSAASKFADQHLYWIGKHFGGDVSERFKNKLTEALNTGLSKGDFARVLSDEFKQLKRSESYWRGLAENAEIRTRELASSDAYERLGIKELEIIAVMDERTTDICREMNGRLVPVAAMSETREKLLNVQTEGMSTDEVKTQINSIVPFWSDKQTSSLAGKSTSSIIGQNPGLSLPPFHWRCRTRTAPYFSNETVSISRGSNPITRKDKYFNNLRDKEIANKYLSVKNKKHYTYAERDFLDDKIKHGKNEFGLNEWDYKRKAQDIINGADKVLARTYNNQLQFEFYSYGNKGYAVVDTNGVIRGCFGHDNLKKALEGKADKSYTIGG